MTPISEEKVNVGVIGVNSWVTGTLDASWRGSQGWSLTRTVHTDPHGNH
jgi:hypothetical protein